MRRQPPYGDQRDRSAEAEERAGLNAAYTFARAGAMFSRSSSASAWAATGSRRTRCNQIIAGLELAYARSCTSS
jgi:hypothetical protein